MFKSILFFLTSISLSLAAPLTYQGDSGPGKGKHIVFIANEHEYRAEEVSPLLAKILAKHHGFKCSVLFGINEQGHIAQGDVPIPHLEILDSADLVFFYTRFMNLPDDQVKQLVSYYEKGGPTIGLRTSTHAFNGQGGEWAKLNTTYEGEDYRGGFGEQIFGNTWHDERGQSHYGKNHQQGCRISPLKEVKHPILTGVKPFHAYSGAYLSRPPAGSTPLLEAQVLNSFGPSEDFDTTKAVVNAGWTRDHYIAPSGEKKEARVVYASYGAAEDMLDDGARRLLVNSAFWALGMENAIKADLKVDLVGEFSPSPYTTGALGPIGVKPADLEGWDSQIMPSGTKIDGIENGGKKERWLLTRALKNRPETLKKIETMYPDFNLDTFGLKPSDKKSPTPKK